MFDAVLTRLAGRPGFSACYRATTPLARTPPRAPNLRFAGLPPLPAFVPPRSLAGRAHAALEAMNWRRHRPDLVHPTFYPAEDLFPRLPAVVHVYDLIHELIPLADDMPNHAAFLAIKARWLRRAQRIVCISESTRAALVGHYRLDADRVRVIPLAGGDGFRPMEPAAARAAVAPLAGLPDRPFMLFIGSRQRYKNFHRLLRAYGTWRRRDEVALVVAGARPGPQDAMALDLAGQPAHVHFIGHVDDAQLNALYNLARFFVYPSAMEGFGIPLLEAMAAGCPIAASDIPAFREVAGGAPDYFDPDAPESVHAAFERALVRRDDAAFVRTPPRPAQPYSWDRCAEAFLALYQELA